MGQRQKFMNIMNQQDMMGGKVAKPNPFKGGKAAKAKPKNHPGFKSVQKKIAADEGVSEDQAGAILGAATRKAGPKARKANPRLNRVKGGY